MRGLIRAALLLDVAAAIAVAYPMLPEFFPE